MRTLSLLLQNAGHLVDKEMLMKEVWPAALMRVSNRSRSTLTRALAGRSRPRTRNQQLLKSILHRLGVV